MTEEQMEKNSDRVPCDNDGILDEQAKEDLLNLVNNGIDMSAFISVLECVGCLEEFREYRNKMEAGKRE